MDVDGNGHPVPSNRSVNRKLFIGGQVTVSSSSSLNAAAGRNRTLKPLKITEYPDTMEFQGKHPVIRVSFKQAVADSYKEVEQRLKNAVKDLFLQYNYLTDRLPDRYDREKFRNYTTGRFDTADLEIGIYYLSQMLHKCYRKYSFVFIDDYDAPINHLYLKLNHRLTDCWNENDKQFDRSLDNWINKYHEGKQI